MTAIIYTRVSTRRQGDSGLGLDAQEQACRAAAQRLGIEVASVALDVVSGGAPLDKRPGLLGAIGELNRGDVLLVAKRDRLTRDPIAGALVERLVARRGGRVVSAAGEGTDGDDPTSVLMRRIVDAFAEYERLLIGARTKAALRAKRARGERCGQVPLGYDADESGRLVELDDEQEALSLVRELRAGGLSIRAIAARLNEMGVQARGSKWHATSVARVLKRGAA